MPGSIVTMWPTSSVSVDSVERRGASCTASPTPWPRPWPKFSPKPASVIGSRARSSASIPVRPALMFAHARFCAARHTSYASRSLSGSPPVERVRVQSLQ